MLLDANKTLRRHPFSRWFLSLLDENDEKIQWPMPIVSTKLSPLICLFNTLAKAGKPTGEQTGELTGEVTSKLTSKLAERTKRTAIRRAYKDIDGVYSVGVHYVAVVSPSHWIERGIFISIFTHELDLFA